MTVAMPVGAVRARSPHKYACAWVDAPPVVADERALADLLGKFGRGTGDAWAESERDI